MKDFTQSICLAHSAAAIYSDSFVDKATTDWRSDLHDTGPFAKETMKPVTERLLVGHWEKSESEYARGVVLEPEYVIDKDCVPLRYRRTCFAAAQ